MYLAVCDDRKEELDALLSLLEKWERKHDAALRPKAFQSAVELVETARQERFTLYLLDVMMPGMDGLECARETRRFDDAAEIVFLSTSPGFAYESYGVRALNYLLKPVRGGDPLPPAGPACPSGAKAPGRPDPEDRLHHRPGALYPHQLCGGHGQARLFSPDGPGRAGGGGVAEGL